MRRVILAVTAMSCLCCWSFLTLLKADEPAKVPTSRIVGSVYGKAVTAGDIGLSAPIDPTVKFDSRDDARWELMGRIMTAFGGPIVDRFVKSQKIEATADEIEKFKIKDRKASEQNVREWEARLVELNKELAAPNLSNEKKAKLTKEQAMYEKFVAATRDDLRAADFPEDVARMVIVNWKIERDLHRMYGGRVIFQQAGLEALDARRLLFEQAEKEGDLKFDDAGVRHMFYYYSNMQHRDFPDVKALEKPWFLDSGN